MTPQGVVILGNSAAAISAVRGIRATGCDWPITMVSREACDAYSPVLTTYYLRGVVEEKGLYACDASFYLRGSVERCFGSSVVELDVEAQRVVTDDGRRIDYDVLLVATGASPRRVNEVDPQVASEIRYLRTIEDARRIRELASRAKHIVVLGGGLVSLQVATAVARPDLRVTVVVTSHQILSQNIDQASAALVQGHILRSSVVSLLFGRTVTAVTRAGVSFCVILDTGEELTADVVVAGKGVTPNIDFIDPAQVAMRQGLLVDDHLRTSVPNVFAAGDLAEGCNRITGREELVPNWINACEQGWIAGANMVGCARSFAGSVPENITTLLGLPVASIGLTRIGRGDSDMREVTHVDEERCLYRKLVFDGDRLMGALLVSDITDAGVLRCSVVQGSDLGISERRAASGGVSRGMQVQTCLRGKYRRLCGED